MTHVGEREIGRERQIITLSGKRAEDHDQRGFVEATQIEKGCDTSTVWTARACFGKLIQIDGSPRDWFEGRTACVLLVFIDDETGKLVQLQFVDSL